MVNNSTKLPLLGECRRQMDLAYLLESETGDTKNCHLWNPRSVTKSVFKLSQN